MKLYRCNWRDQDLGYRISWHASKREAENAMRQLDKTAHPEGVESVNVPTTKRELITWLNSHYNSDNG